MPMSVGNWITCHKDGGEKHYTQTRRRRDDNGRSLEAYKQPECSFEDAFIRGLVAAGTCRKHRKLDTNRQRSHRRPFSTGLHRKVAAIAVPDDDHNEVSRHDYERLVDIYPSFGKSATKKGAKGLVAQEKHEHMPLAPRLVITPEQELLPPHSKRPIVPPEDEEHRKQLKAFVRLLEHKPGTMNLDKLWRMYHGLRSPRPRYLTDNVLRRALRHFGWVEFWHQPNAMQRYFQVLNDCLAEDVRIESNQWSTAISFAGRCVRHLTNNEIRRAIETWMHMEQHGHAADHVTFNILFDVAVKAGRFALADTIYNEIKSRDMPLDRWARGSLIYYAGLRREGDSVRKAFKEFVESGEIVDTKLMNCVVVSLLRAGEPSAAEHVFERMKSLHQDKFGTRSLSDWRATKEMKILLNQTAKQLRKEKQNHETTFFGAPFSSDQKRDEIQKAAPIAPDADTYMILIKYHAYTSGDIDKIWDLMEEMREQEFRLHGSTYVHLLRGFHAHGGYPFSAWNHRRLEEIWQEVVRFCSPSIPPPNTQGTLIVDQKVDGVRKASRPTDVPDEDFEALDAAQYGNFGDSDSSTVIEGKISEDDDAADDGHFDMLGHTPYMTTGFAVAAIRAFYHCMGRKRMLAVWEELKTRWVGEPDIDWSRIEMEVQKCQVDADKYVDAAEDGPYQNRPNSF
ncbi:Pentatricopeptide repeat-containing protein [Pseudocercospora fuligena]|uniref:Pentatricopeptide repeat-containing protein n=1 Tax=Pseudocercospora fuligena TaxID=685502 RepID=A0A8H6R8E4_9PEZI|nr:Pentatricopeptide repeat-containing protein [Pseudocercospora fuligena]